MHTLGLQLPRHYSRAFGDHRETRKVSSDVFDEQQRLDLSQLARSALLIDSYWQHQCHLARNTQTVLLLSPVCVDLGATVSKLSWSSPYFDRGVLRIRTRKMSTV